MVGGGGGEEWGRKKWVGEGSQCSVRRIDKHRDRVEERDFEESFIN